MRPLAISPHRSVLVASVLLGLAATTAALPGAAAPAAPPAEAAAATVAPAPVVLTLAVAPSGTALKIRVENTGELPVRLVADARLLTLEITPPPGTSSVTEKAAPKGVAAKAGARRTAEPTTIRCTLPADARPGTDDEAGVVLSAKRSWSTTVDPLFYCFGPRERAALVSGATVRGYLGWPTPPPPRNARPGTKATASAPFVVAPVGAAVATLAPSKELVSADITWSVPAASPASVPALPTDAPADDAPSASDPPDGPSLSLSLPEAVDVARGNEIATTLTLANRGRRPAVLLFRSEALAFSVSVPGGGAAVRCGTPRAIGSPIRELYSTVGVGGRSQLPILLTGICPGGTFDTPGIYRVEVRLDTTRASGRKIGLKTWDGEVTADGILLVRVRTPRKVAPLPRPLLD